MSPPRWCAKGAGAFDCWCKRTYGSTEYPTLTTGRLGDSLDRDATTDGCLIDRGRVAHRRTRRRSPTCAPGDAGELLAAVPRCSSAISTPRSTTTSFLPGGWFRTGDLARYDGEYLTIVDRLKDVIIRGGENISAQEVEALLVTHPGVVEAACVATARSRDGRGSVRVRDREPVTPHLRSRICARISSGRAWPGSSCPSRLEVRTEFPRTASGKVQKVATAGRAQRGQPTMSSGADFGAWVRSELSARLAPRPARPARLRARRRQ